MQHQVKIKNFLPYVIFIIFIIMLFYFNIISFPSLAIISESKNVIFENGKVYNIATLTIDKITETTYLFKPQEYKLSNGSIIKGQENISIKFTPESPFCVYRLSAQSEPIIFGNNLNLWKIYYMSNPSITSNIRVNIKGEDKILDGSTVGTKVVFFENDKDGGVLEVTTQGALMAKETCPSPSGLIVLNNNNFPKVVSQALYNERKDAKLRDCFLICGIPFYSGSCVSCATQYAAILATGADIPSAENFKSFNQLTFTDEAGTQIKTGMKGMMPINLATNPLIQLKADQNYFESVIFSEITTKPKIISLSCQQVSEEKTTTVSAIIENTGGIDAVYNLKMTVNKGTIQPTTSSLLVQANQQNRQNYVWSIPSVSANENYILTLTACSDAGCDNKTCTNTILNNPTQPTSFCGNKICEAGIGETYTTCSIDCPQSQKPIECPANSKLINNECVCNDGYLKKFNVNTGAMYCEKEKTTNMFDNLLIYILFGFSLLILIILLIRRVKK